MDWTISPYLGVGELKFGMSQANVARLLGPAVTITQAKDIPFLEPEDYEGLYSHEEVRAYGGEDYEKTMPTVAYLDDSAVSFTFFEVHQTLNIGGIPFFDGLPRDNILRLKDMSQSIVHAGEESYFFMDLGITLLDENMFDFSDTVIVFARGQYDRFIRDGLESGYCQLIKGSLDDLI
ncbi:hypothetical protein FNJ84_01720 [Paracoccus sp. M683]|nr:hypothetical protein [Paracoccus sp. M683]TRW99419.1 hypothetical protein FNJ84_01720 [Paracoccus sp. M683]